VRDWEPVPHFVAQHDMLSQHFVYKTELIINCNNFSKERRNSLMMIRKDRIGVVLSVLSESYIGAFVG